MNCNDWQDIVSLVWEKFCLLIDEKQVDYVEKYSNISINIFPTETFSDFCKEHFPENYLKVAQMAVDGNQNNEFDMYKPWCCCNIDDELLETGDEPTDFVEDEEYFVEDLLNDNTTNLEDIGFTKEEAEEIMKTYQELQ